MQEGSLCIHKKRCVRDWQFVVDQYHNKPTGGTAVLFSITRACGYRMKAPQLCLVISGWRKVWNKYIKKSLSSTKTNLMGSSCGANVCLIPLVTYVTLIWPSLKQDEGSSLPGFNNRVDALSHWGLWLSFFAILSQIINLSAKLTSLHCETMHFTL